MKDTENDATKTGRERHPGVALAGQREIGEDICTETEKSLSGCSSPPRSLTPPFLPTAIQSTNMGKCPLGLAPAGQLL